MADDYDWLKQLIDDDEDGLLDVAPAPRQITPSQRLRARFEELNLFIDAHGRRPAVNDGDVIESNLCHFLEYLLADSGKRETVKDLDRHRLFENLPDEPAEWTLEAILASEEFREDEQDIFTIKHITPTQPDYVGRTTPCADFEKFRPLLEKCHAEIARGDRVLSPFVKEESIRPGTFFVENGVLLYVAEVGEKTMQNGRNSARLRCIFDNGTESDILNWTLAKNLYKDGKIVSPDNSEFLRRFGAETKGKPTGFIYVLRSKKKEEQIQSIKDLYKIGFCTTPVEQRISNALNDTTYLCGPVEIVAEYATYDTNVQKLESIIHTFFDSARVAIKTYDSEGNEHKVREWFNVPFPVIRYAVRLIAERKITGYRYDRDRKKIVEK